MLHAFASGCTALTGVEAISSGVPAFRHPKRRNAATTLAVMASSASRFTTSWCWCRVDKASQRAPAYARGLPPTSLRAVSVNLSTDGSTELFAGWEELDIDVPLEIVDSPYRSITESIRQYVRLFEPDGGERVLTVVIPEVVARHWYHHPLHSQTPILIKDTLLFEPGVVTVSVPYHPADVEIPHEDVFRTTAG